MFNNAESVRKDLVKRCFDDMFDVVVRLEGVVGVLQKEAVDREGLIATRDTEAKELQKQLGGLAAAAGIGSVVGTGGQGGLAIQPHLA